MLIVRRYLQTDVLGAMHIKRNQYNKKTDVRNSSFFQKVHHYGIKKSIVIKINLTKLTYEILIDCLFWRTRITFSIPYFSRK